MIGPFVIDSFSSWFQVSMLILQLSCIGIHSCWFFRKAWYMLSFCRRHKASVRLWCVLALLLILVTAYLGFILGQVWFITQGGMTDIMSLWLPVCLFYLAATLTIRAFYIMIYLL